MRRLLLLALLVFPSAPIRATYCPSPWSMMRTVSYASLGCHGNSLAGSTPCLTGQEVEFRITLFWCESVEWRFTGGTGSGARRVFSEPGHYTASAHIHRIDGLETGASVTVPVVYGFAIGKASAAEAGPDSVAEIVITRGAPPDSTSTIEYATTDGTARAGIDYVLTTGTLVFAPGEVNKTIKVPLILDDVFEMTAFNLTISNPSKGQIVGPATVSVPIANDEPPPEISFMEARYDGVEGESLRLTVERTGSPASFRALIQSDTGWLPTQALAFDATETRKSIDVPLLENACYDVERGGKLRLTAFDGAVVAPLRGTAPFTIADNEERPTLDIHDLALPEGSYPYTSGYVSMTLTGPVCTPFEIELKAIDGTAKASDYFVDHSPLEFDRNRTERRAWVIFHGDDLMEPDETFFLEIAPWPGRVRSGRTRAMVTILNDDGPPHVVAVEAHGGQTTVRPTSTIRFHVEFAPKVDGVDSTDFAVIEQGLHGSSIETVSGNDSEYDVVVRVGALTAGSSTAALALRIVDDDTIVDELGNPLGGPGADNGSYATAALAVVPAMAIPLADRATLIALAIALAVIAHATLMLRSAS